MLALSHPVEMRARAAETASIVLVFFILLNPRGNPVDSTIHTPISSSIVSPDDDA